MEDWYTIPNYSTYEINRKLQVRNRVVKKIRKFYIEERYLRATLQLGSLRYNAPLHRLVALTFVPNPDPINKVEVHHIDGDTFNNEPANLQWVTKQEHIKLSITNGQRYCKLSTEDVIFIRENFWLLGKEALMEKFNVAGVTILGIAIGRNRKNVAHPPKHYDARPMEKYKPIIDLQTGIFYTSDELSFVLGKPRRYIHRMLNEERKPNTTQYRYA